MTKLSIQQQAFKELGEVTVFVADLTRQIVASMADGKFSLVEGITLGISILPEAQAAFTGLQFIGSEFQTATAEEFDNFKLQVRAQLKPLFANVDTAEIVDDAISAALSITHLILKLKQPKPIAS